jgi:hypothetical protein
MNKAEFQRAFLIAESDKELNDDMDVFIGCALRGFEIVYITVESVARLIRWQCRQFDGTWDQEELQSIVSIARNKFTLVN